MSRLSFKLHCGRQGLYGVRLGVLLGVLLGTLGPAVMPVPGAAQDYVPPGRGLPGRREGGGTRGACLPAQSPQPNSLPLTAMIPNTNFGLTIAEYPTLFWYVPENSAAAAEFILLDHTGTEVYQTVVPIAPQPGVIRLQLPRDGSLPPLTVGKDYQWFFALICDPLDRSADVLTEGWIQRVEPSAALVNQLAAAAPETQPTIYARSGIWYEAIATLATLRYAQPDNTELASQWQSLLQSVGLGELANQPLRLD
ncbi:MAG: DUF928 domain-containing protein [Synechococcales cyanobacterium C42_A2020_086]|nr:DUF928 domain-containing protein [Synechococcales cyanobacterium M58_A2018_015]MBF2076812.1 DUF928 domain-containing protein [Synechococcales cyanobacterium C42_A2020_086]